MFAGLKPTDQVTMSFRIPEPEALRIQAEADRLGLKRSQLIRSWVMQRLNE